MSAEETESWRATRKRQPFLTPSNFPGPRADMLYTCRTLLSDFLTYEYIQAAVAGGPHAFKASKQIK